MKSAIVLAMFAHHHGGTEVGVPTIEAPPVREAGRASWYGDGRMHGRTTASGETLDPEAYTCAHRTLPFDTMVLVVNVADRRRRVWCRVNDRGPYGARLEDGTWVTRFSSSEPGEWRGVMDLTRAAAETLGTTGGLGRVELHYFSENRPSRLNLAALELR